MSTTAVPRPAPSRWAPPVIGNTLAYVKDPLALMRTQYAACGPVSEMGLAGSRWTMLIGPDACAAALTNRDKAFASGPGWGELVGPFFERGLMLLDGAEHHDHRRLMQEAFTRPRLEGYTAALSPAIAEGVGAWSGGARFPVYPALKALTLDLATEVFMGGAPLARPGEIERVNEAFIACVQAATGFVKKPLPGTRWGRAAKGRVLLEEFLLRHLPAARDEERDDLFSTLCHLQGDDGERFTDRDLVNHMIFLLMAGHDTSTITATSMIRFLGQHPEWQERCREEVAGLPEHPSLTEVEGLVGLDLVMKESLRLVPPVPVLARRTVKETEVLGFRIPADRMVSVNVLFSHYMAEYWTEPERFDPDRFAEPRREDKGHRFAWEPFGGGVHKCIGLYFGGLEVKLVLIHLLRSFDWSVDPAYAPPMNNHSLPFPSDGLPVDLVRRVGRLSA